MSKYSPLSLYLFFLFSFCSFQRSATKVRACTAVRMEAAVATNSCYNNRAGYEGRNELNSSPSATHACHTHFVTHAPCHARLIARIVGAEEGGSAAQGELHDASTAMNPRSCSALTLRAPASRHAIPILLLFPCVCAPAARARSVSAQRERAA